MKFKLDFKEILKKFYGVRVWVLLAKLGQGVDVNSEATENYYERGTYASTYLNNINFPLFMLKVLKLHLFCLPILVDSCSKNYFLTKSLCIGSGLGLNVIAMCFMMLSLCFNSYLLGEHHWNHHAKLGVLNVSTCWEATQFLSLFLDFCSCLVISKSSSLWLDVVLCFN